MTLAPNSILIQLGRAGDILNLFPLLERAGGGFIVCNPDYASLFESVTYAKCIPYSGSIEDYPGAFEMVKNLSRPIHICQRFGNPEPRPRLSDSFLKDAWLAAGIAPTPANGFGSLTIDMRYPADERALLKKHRHTTKPLLLLNLSGFSSPYPNADALRAFVDERFAETFEIVDLGPIRAKHFCDLLGLYDAAAVLLTTDTATLHLAPASEVPVIHLKPPGWYGSTRKGNCILQHAYHDTNFQIIADAIESTRETAPRTRLWAQPKSSMEIWYAVPTANPSLCGRTFEQWQKMGYKTAALVDGGMEAPAHADMIVRLADYPGYAKSVNLLCGALASADIVVTGGDDILPDPDSPAQKIAEEFVRYFGGTYGVMQPVGDTWGGIDKYAGSPWMGREFIKRAYGGDGPLWPGYFHYFSDTELQHAAIQMGVFWQRRDVTQKHLHFSRHGQPMPDYLSRAKKDWERSERLFNLRKANGFPGLCLGHEPGKSPNLPRVGLTILFNGLHHMTHDGYFERMARALDRWVIVEGAAESAGSTAWCKGMPRHWHKDGHSVDGSLAYLEGFVERNPHVTLVRRDGPWPSKDAQVNAGLDALRDVEESWLWQIDADEVWSRGEMETAERLLAQSSGNAGLFQFHHFVGRDIVAVGKWGGAWNRRLWRWRGEPFVSHEPPMLAGDFADVHLPVKYRHYAYYFPQDVEFKSQWYQNHEDVYANWLELQKETRFPQPLSRLFGEKSWGLSNDQILRLETGGVCTF